MASVTAIRQGLADAVAAIDGLRTEATVPAQINPPVAIIGAPSIEYDASFSRGADRYVFEVSLFVSSASARASQNNLDAYLESEGTNSVKVAIEADPTLGGAAHTARVVSCTPAEEVNDGAALTYLAVKFQVEVYA